MCSNIIDDMEYACYCQWFDYIMKQNRPQLDLIGECGARTGTVWSALPNFPHDLVPSVGSPLSL